MTSSTVLSVVAYLQFPCPLVVWNILSIIQIVSHSAIEDPVAFSASFKDFKHNKSKAGVVCVYLHMWQDRDILHSLCYRCLNQVVPVAQGGRVFVPSSCDCLVSHNKVLGCVSWHLCGVVFFSVMDVSVVGELPLYCSEKPGSKSVFLLVDLFPLLSRLFFSLCEILFLHCAVNFCIHWYENAPTLVSQVGFYFVNLSDKIQ